MRDCDDYQVLISRMLDDDLNAGERADLARHVKTCPDCAAVYVAFRSLSENLGRMEEPPKALHENVMAAVRRDRVRSQAVKKHVTRHWGSMLAAAACLVVIVAAGFNLPRLIHARSSGNQLQSAPAALFEAAQAPMQAEEDAVEDAAPAEAAEPERAGGLLQSAAENGQRDEKTADSASAHEEPDYGPRKDYDEFTLNAEQSLSFREALGHEQAILHSAPDREIHVRYQDEDGEKALVLLLCGDEAIYVSIDGDSFYQYEGGSEALLALLGEG